MTRKAPKVNSLVCQLEMTREEATQAREAMHRGKLGQVKAEGFFGVEYVRDTEGEWLFCYLNAGDTYTPTIVRRRGSDAYRISTVGDEVEALEHRGIHIY